MDVQDRLDDCVALEPVYDTANQEPVDTGNTISVSGNTISVSGYGLASTVATYTDGITSEIL